MLIFNVSLDGQKQIVSSNLNTSNVNLQYLKHSAMFWKSLNLNTSNVNLQSVRENVFDDLYEFKYIKC